jgi:hypothetical protein
MSLMEFTETYKNDTRDTFCEKEAFPPEPCVNQDWPGDHEENDDFISKKIPETTTTSHIISLENLENVYWKNEEKGDVLGEKLSS